VTTDNQLSSIRDELDMTHSWIDIELRDQWTLSSDEMALLPGMTDRGRLGFAAQLKFMQIHGRFPERHEEIDPNATQWLGAQNWCPSRYAVRL
jgi:hypothetical protein